MKKVFLLTICLILCASPAFGATKYYAQSAAGSEDGSSCANADAIADITYSVSDEIHLCGTITTAMTIGANTVTVIFETGAKMSAATWTAGTGFINASNKSSIVIDGGTNGIIEATDNGTTATFGGTKSTSDNIYGVYFNECTSCEIKNLTIQGIYDRKPNSTDCLTVGFPIYWAGNLSGMSVHNNTISDGTRGIFGAYTGTSTDGINIYSNTVSDCGVGINIGPGNTDYTATNVNIYSNTVTGGSKWEGTFNTETCEASGCGSGCATDDHHHQDGIAVQVVSSGSTLSNLYIYSNYLQDFGATSTAHIYVEQGASSTISNARIYNNVAVCTGANFPANGAITVKRTDGTDIYNNTLVCGDLGRGILLNTSPTNMVIKNNIISHFPVAIYFAQGDSFTASYNIFHGMTASTVFVGEGSPNTNYDWAAVVAAGWGGNSSTDDPLLDGTYKIGTSSPAKWVGTATGQLSSTDKLGIAWHSPPSIGAYEYYETGSIRGVTASGVTIQ